MKKKETKPIKNQLTHNLFWINSVHCMEQVNIHLIVVYLDIPAEKI